MIESRRVSRPIFGFTKDLMPNLLLAQTRSTQINQAVERELVAVSMNQFEACDY